jgi:hypothetical protein
MFKLIGRLISLLLIAALVFLALSVWRGGEPFRWFGKQSKEAGEIIGEQSETLGKEADKIKKKSGEMQKTKGKVNEGIRKTKETIDEFTGSKPDK